MKSEEGINIEIFNMNMWRDKDLMRRLSIQVMLFLMVFIIVAESSVLYCFAADYVVEIVSVETGRMFGGLWRANSCFFHTEGMSVKVMLRNNDNDSRTATIYVNAFDDLSKPFNLYTTNITLSAGETRTLYVSVYIPKWAAAGGNCCVKVTAKTLPEGSYSPERVAEFCLLPGIPSYLVASAFSTRGTQVYYANVWVDGDSYSMPVAVPLASGTHSLKVQTKFFCFENEVEYTYEFNHWEDGSISNLRTVSISQNSNMTVTAYYTRYRSLVQQK